MGRCGSMALYLTTIVLLVALFASSAKCRPEPLDNDDKASSGNGNAMALNSTAAAASVNGSSGGGGSGDVKLVWCLTKSCVYEGRGNAPCFCCAAIKPNDCYDTMGECRSNCV